MSKYDVIILGAGPAGLTAGLYSARNNLKTLILDRGAIGGKLNSYESIENYPSYEGNTQDLIETLAKQVTDLGVEIEDYANIDNVALTKKLVAYNNVLAEADNIIIATGSQPRKLGIEGENLRGVSYCAVCDGPMYKGKTVAVIGGGNSALEEACFLTRFVNKVFLLHRRDEFRADKIIQDKVKENNKIEIIFNAKPVKLEGEGRLNRLVFEQEGTTRAIMVDGVFPFIGTVPNTKMFEKYENFLDEKGFIMTNDYLETGIPNVYAVGDVRTTKLRQVVTATADGALAGYMCVLNKGEM